jgi:hypothetical protein
MATESEIKEVMLKALANAEKTHGKPMGRKLSMTIGESGVVINAIYDALSAAKMLTIDPQKKSKP